MTEEKANSKKEKPILTDDEIKKRRSRKKRVSAAAFVLLLAVGAMGNWYYENSNISSKIEPLLTSSETKTLGEAKYVDATTEIAEDGKENEYFSSARVDRETSRDEALKNLQAVIDSPEESEQAKKAAEADIAKISTNISIENKIETLVTAKGINNCIAVINNDSTRVDIIIDVEELTDSVILQVKEIAIQQLNCTFEDVTIIQSK